MFLHFYEEILRLDKLFLFWYDFGMKSPHRQQLIQWQTTFFDQLGEVRELLRMWDMIPALHFFLKNRQGQFLAVNQATMTRLGVKQESDILGKTDFDFHSSELAAAYVNEDRRVMETGKALLDQLWTVVDHQGIHEWYLSSKTPLRNRQGDVVGVAGVMRRVDHHGDFINLYGELGGVVQQFLENYAHHFSMAALAESIQMSLSSFERRFDKVFGKSPTEYLQNVRVHAARAMLERDDKSLAEIARLCGFYDQSQFGKIFKRISHMTPAEYRKIYRRETRH